MNELPAALARNAASKPLNLVVLVVAFGLGFALSASAAIGIIAAVVLYTVAVARTMFDGDEIDRVQARLDAASDDES